MHAAGLPEFQESHDPPHSLSQEKAINIKIVAAFGDQKA
jgi:hypothetical protein